MSTARMRSRIAWIILGLAVVLIAIELTRFNLAALQNPSRFETRVADRASVSSFAKQAAGEFLRVPRTQKRVWTREVRITA